jgi:hypothetical protein
VIIDNKEIVYSIDNEPASQRVEKRKSRNWILDTTYNIQKDEIKVKLFSPGLLYIACRR